MSTVKVVAEKKVTSAPAEEAKVSAIIKSISQDKETFLSLEDRLHRLNVLFDLQKKYNALQASLQKLTVFKLSHESETAVLRFRDDEHNEFSTGNTEVMSEFLDFLKGTIKRKIKEIEPLLIW